MVYVRLHAVSRAVVRWGGRAPSGDWFRETVQYGNQPQTAMVAATVAENVP
jgi:hypothetical protein